MKQIHHFFEPSARNVLASIGLIVLLFFVFLISAHSAYTDELSNGGKIDTFALSPQNSVELNPLSNLNLGDKKRQREKFFADKTRGNTDVSINAALDSDFQPAPAQAPAATVAPDLISDVTFDFSVSNPTDQTLSLLTIPTGIKQGTLNYIRVEGATGYEWQDGELVIAYVSLPPHGSAIVTVTGLPLISTDPVTIDIAPRVRNKNGALMAQNKSLQKVIAPKSIEIMSHVRSVWEKDHGVVSIDSSGRAIPIASSTAMSASSTGATR